jgi:hypothetical protein
VKSLLDAARHVEHVSTALDQTVKTSDDTAEPVFPWLTLLSVDGSS